MEKDSKRAIMLLREIKIQMKKKKEFLIQLRKLDLPIASMPERLILKKKAILESNNYVRFLIREYRSCNSLNIVRDFVA